MTPKGTIVPGKGGRLFALVRLDGGKYRAEVDLDTDDLALARRRQRQYVAKYLAENPPGVPLGTRKKYESAITLDDVATQHYDVRVRKGIKEAKHERRWYVLHIKEHLGPLQPRSVSPDIIESVLLACVEKGLSPKSLDHVRGEISKLLKSARKQKLITDNPMELVETPVVAADERVRAQLTDDEFVRWALFPSTTDFSAVENEQRIAKGEQPLISREIQTMGILARTIGGLRASDCHALTWERVDLESRRITIYRPKVSKKKARLDEYEIPEPVIPFLLRWWDDHGQPTTGPVFPACRAGYTGSARWAGEHKVRTGYSAKLRRDLLTAGITRHELHHETATSLPVGFHDFRRAFVSALRRANVDARTAMALASHKSWAVHQGYDTASRGPMVIPGAAVPLLAAPAVASGPANDPNHAAELRQVAVGESGIISECPAVSRHAVRHADQGPGGILGALVVEPRGIEPLTSALRTQRSPS
jgi:integrase